MGYHHPLLPSYPGGRVKRPILSFSEYDLPEAEVCEVQETCLPRAIPAFLSKLWLDTQNPGIPVRSLHSFDPLKSGPHTGVANIQLYVGKCEFPKES